MFCVFTFSVLTRRLPAWLPPASRSFWCGRCSCWVLCSAFMCSGAGKEPAFADCIHLSSFKINPDGSFCVWTVSLCPDHVAAHQGFWLIALGLGARSPCGFLALGVAQLPLPAALSSDMSSPGVLAFCPLSCVFGEHAQLAERRMDRCLLHSPRLGEPPTSVAVLPSLFWGPHPCGACCRPVIWVG